MDRLSNLNMKQNQILQLVLQNLASAPTSPTPVEGQQYYNTVDHRAYIFNGTIWLGMDATGATMTGDNIITAINAATSKIDDDNLSTGVNGAVTNSHTHSNKTTLDNTTAAYTTTEASKLSAIEASADVTDAANVASSIAGVNTKTPPINADSFTIIDSAASNVLKRVLFSDLKTTLKTYFDGYYNNYTHPNHSGDVTSVADGTTTIAAKAVTLTKMNDMATASILGRKTALAGAPEVLSKSDVLTLLNVADGANAYVHPTGDGDKHVPATSTTNSGKILIAGGTAGVFAWGTNTPAWANITDKPSSTVTDIDSAVSLKHTQNTDTGTTSTTFTIGTGGPKIKNSSGEIQFRNNGDTDYADIRVKNLVVEGTTTTINSNEVNIGDSEILLNADITTSAGNSDGGIAVKRLMADNTTPKNAKITFNNSTGKWETVSGAITTTLVTAQIANKVSATFGNGTLSSFTITHNLNSRDVTVTIRETGSPYAMVLTDVAMTTLDTITITTGTVIPTTNQYTAIIVG